MFHTAQFFPLTNTFSSFSFSQVYIDVPYGSDPEIKFPVVILPPSRHGPWVSGMPAPFGHGSKPHWNDHPHHPQPGAAGPPRYLYPPEPVRHPHPSPPGGQPMATNPSLHPPPFLNPAAAAAYPGPSAPLPMHPNPTDQLPPPQYDQVAHPAPTAPPLYPTLPTPDFLSTPSAPQYVPGAAGNDFLSNTSAPQQYPGPAAAPSFLSSPDSRSDPGYDPPTYEMVFPNAPASGSTPNATASDEPITTKPPS